MGERNGNLVRRRVIYREQWERLIDYVDNELPGGGPAPPGGGPAPPGGRPPGDTTEWIKQRRTTISTIDELLQKLDKVCVYCNYGKGVGDAAEIAGAATSIVAALMALNGSSSSDTVMNVGKLLQNSGALVGGVSNVAESLLSNKYLRDVEAVLKRDQELSRPLINWLVTSAFLNETIRELFGTDLTSPLLGTILKTFYEFSRLFECGTDFHTTWNVMKRGQYSVFLDKEVKMEYFQKLFEELAATPASVGKVRNTLRVLSGDTIFLKLCFKSYRGIQWLCGEDPVKLLLLKGGIKPEIPTSVEVSWFCGFQAIHLAARIVSLTNVVRAIRKGESEYSDALKQLSNLLNEELRSIEAIINSK